MYSSRNINRVVIGFGMGDAMSYGGMGGMMGGMGGMGGGYMGGGGGGGGYSSFQQGSSFRGGRGRGGGGAGGAGGAGGRGRGLKSKPRVCCAMRDYIYCTTYEYIMYCCNRC